MRFRNDSDEEMCGRSVEVPLKWYSPLACLRRSGHDGPCEAILCDAARADGVCHDCREPLGLPHRFDCLARAE